MLTYIILRNESLFYMHRMFKLRREYRHVLKESRKGAEDFRTDAIDGGINDSLHQKTQRLVYCRGFDDDGGGEC